MARLAVCNMPALFFAVAVLLCGPLPSSAQPLLPSFDSVRMSVVEAISASSTTDLLRSHLEAALKGLPAKVVVDPEADFDAEVARFAAVPPANASTVIKGGIPSAVAVIGAGLSGLTAALRLLEGGVPVILVDRNAYFGGNRCVLPATGTPHSLP